MARRRKAEPSGVDALFDFLVAAPAWAGPLLAGVAFVVFRWVIPAVLQAAAPAGDAHALLGTSKMLSAKAAPFIAGGVLLIWAAATITKLTNARRLESQSGAASIAQLNWRQFELLLAEAFRREGFTVREGAVRAAPGGADGGVDLRLEKGRKGAGAVTLVQCKQWRTQRVGVKIVRELLGVVASEGAHSGIIVTSGGFTDEAVAFAAKNPIRLIDGAELERMIAVAQRSGRMTQAAAAAPPHPQPAPTPATCPTCNAPMVRRVAKTGPHAGKEFFGCPRYPACRGIRQVS